MLKAEILIVTLFAGALAMLAYVMVDFTQNRAEKVDWCKQAGGITVIGDKGYFKICLRPEAVIEMPKK